MRRRRPGFATKTTGLWKEKIPQACQFVAKCFEKPVAVITASQHETWSTLQQAVPGHFGRFGEPEHFQQGWGEVGQDALGQAFSR